MKKAELSEPPIGIIINIPNIFLDVEYPGGVEEYRRVMERPIMDDEVLWYNFIANIPVHQPLYCYIAFKGFVHYRCIIVDFWRKKSLTFHDARGETTTRPRNWVVLGGPLIKAPNPIPHKFCRGFKYGTEEPF